MEAVGSFHSSEGSLVRDSVVAVHTQLSHALRDEILRMKPGAKIATERQFIDRFDVSRATVRRAIQTLVDEGLLVRRQGKGTFVSTGKLVQTVDRLTSFVESFTAAGITPNATLIEYLWLSEPKEFPPPFASLGGDVLKLRRLYSADGIPIAVAEIFVPEKFGRMISRADIEEHPIYQVLQERAHRQPHNAAITLTCGRVSARTSELLDMRVNDLIPRLQRVTFDDQGDTLECLIAYIRPESFELRTVVAADRPHPVRFSFSSANANRATSRK